MSQCQFAFANSPRSLADLLGDFTGTSHAPWPVWRDSARQPVKFAALPRKKAVRLYHEARQFERRTRQAGRQDGALGRNGLAVLHALIFDFLNFATGALYPSIESIARAACLSPRSVSRGLAKLKAAGVVNWLRRCAEDWINGRFVLRQETNAYAILPTSQWRGYTPEPEPPTPTGDTWGACPPLPSCLDEATAATSHAARLLALALDPHDALAATLARLGAHIAAKKG